MAGVSPCDIHDYLKAYLEEEREVEQSGIVGKVVNKGNNKDYDLGRSPNQ